MNLINILLLLTSIFSVAQSKENKNDCNLLKTYSVQHHYIKFIRCDEGTGQTIKTATYQVKGTNASEVEKYLVENHGMEQLKFACCGWEPENGKLGKVESDKLTKINPDFHLTIKMYSIVSKEGKQYKGEDRTKIAFFYVTVSLVEI